MIDRKYCLSRDQIKALTKEEAIEFYNTWANYWRYDIGINVIPAVWRIVDKEKRFIPIIPWKEYQDKPIPEKMHQEWIDNGSFFTGIAGIFGPVWHRPDKAGYYFGQVDADNALAIKEILAWRRDPNPAAFAKRTIVEQHADNLQNSMHVDVYSSAPLMNKDPDVPKSEKDRPSFEVHCTGRMGIMSPSKHRKGYPMMLLDPGSTIEPMALDDNHFEEYLNSICIKYGLKPYLTSNGNGIHGHNQDSGRGSCNEPYNEHNDGIPLRDDLVEMIKHGYGAYEERIEIKRGTRHKALVKIAVSILFRYSDDYELSKLRDWFILINDHCCKPEPLPEQERNNIWNDAVEYVGKQKALQSKRILTVSEAVREKTGTNKTVRGTIFSISTIFKVATKLAYRCLNCSTVNRGYHSINEGHIKLTIYFSSEYDKQPRKCANCAEKYLTLDHELSEVNDAKIVVLQNVDLTSDTDETLEVMLLGEDTKDVKAGEVVLIQGSIYYGQSNLGGQSRSKKTIALMTAKFITYEGRQNIVITDRDIESFHRFAELNQRDDVIQRLIWMTAPNVIGEEGYKLGVLRSIVGGRKTETKEKGRIDTLSIGDKGLAKSAVMHEAVEMKPNARTITAQSASSKSALGIVESNNDFKTLIYGPIPLSSGSIAGIDELQTWSYDEQGALLNVMQEGRFNLLKWGRNKKIIAETTIIATANPQDIDYNNGRDSISINEIKLLPPLLDRFDQIYVALDEIDEERDWDFSGKWYDYTRNRRPHNYNFIRKYLVYAETIKPVITPEAQILLRKFWINLRQQGIAGKRTLGGIFRIAEATAKLRLKTVVDDKIAQQVQASIQLMQYRLGRAVKLAQDPRDLILNGAMEIIKNTQTRIAFDEAVLLFCKESKYADSWLYGGRNKELDTGNNRRYREVYYRFLQEIRKPDSKIVIMQKSPLVVKWQTAKADTGLAAGSSADAVKSENDMIDMIDIDQNVDDQKSRSDSGDKTIESPNQDSSFSATKSQSVSNMSIMSISQNPIKDNPKYEYLEQVNAYRCLECRGIYTIHRKDLKESHPCNDRLKGGVAN